ncbi:MAG: methionine gamma-lyase family protein [Eubacteriales bacterium]|nr:methionine gamma-lyase family protein [Eubacteriales bacterium]
MISPELRALARQCEDELKDIFLQTDEISAYNTEKVLSAFSEFQLSERHFNPTTGYGYNDDGRDAADRIFARVFGCEDGFVRHNIISGTHAITIGLFGLLRPGDTLYCVTGTPYDTLLGVIGLKGESGSLCDFGIKYRETALAGGKQLNIDEIIRVLNEDKSVKVVYIQRSKGYSERRTLTEKEITTLYDTVKSVSDAYVYVDNCYGEFTNTEEPKADLLAGSLIKNAGGGMADTGGYLVGTKKAVSLAAERYTVPCIGTEAGATLGQNKSILKGIFYAPHTVANAKKTAHFAALLFQKLGYGVNPDPFEMREDIVQIISLGTPEKLTAFCQGIQTGSPVDSFALPVPWDMPGYEDKIIMAAGAFTQGSSIELSADAPLRAPYCVYMQGGLTYESGRYGVLTAAQRVIESN